jgi:F-type H+-transporting ATPase subunit a
MDNNYFISDLSDSHIQSSESLNPHNTQNIDTTSTAIAHHAAHGQTDSGPSGVFPELFGTLGDHHSLSLFNKEITELPVIIYDSKEGFHTYSSLESMNHGKLFTTNEQHKIVRASNPKETVTLDLSITNLVIFQWIAIIIAITLFSKASRRYKKNPGAAPKGVQNFVESIVIFIKEQVVAPNCGGSHITDRLMPYFISLFIFVLFMNLVGLLPGAHTPTGAIGCTGALALTALIIINITAMKEIGIGNWFKHLLGGAPIWLAPIMIPIEIISMFTKPFALTIRLFANMTAGHVVMLSLVGLIFYFFRMGLSSGIVAGGIVPVSVGFSVFMFFLEFLVALLQAYIFTILTAVFTGLAIGEHGKEEHAAKH